MNLVIKITLYLFVVTLAILEPFNNSNAFTLRTSKDGKPLIWSKTQVEVSINPSVVANKTTLPAEAIRAAFSSWTIAGMPINIHFTESNSAVAEQSDGQNVVTWVTSDWKYGKEVVAMTIAMYGQSTGIVSETDIVLNARDHQWTDSPTANCSSFDIQNVMTHEAGHFFGLGHEPSRPDSAMFPTTPTGEISKRKLSDDDLAGIQAIIEEMHTNEGAVDSSNKKDESNPASPTNDSAEIPEFGCSSGGHISHVPWTFWVIIIGLGGLIFHNIRRRILGLVSLLLILGGASLHTAHASIVKKLSLSELTIQSELVIQGKVLGQHSYREGGLIVTDYQLEVTQCYKKICSMVVTFQVLGGEVDGQGMYVEGMPYLKIGDVVIAFGKRQGAKFSFMGLAQGIFRVNGKTAVRDLSGLHLWDKDILQNGRVEQVTLQHLEQFFRKALLQQR